MTNKHQIATALVEDLIFAADELSDKALASLIVRELALLIGEPNCLSKEQ